MPFIRFESQKTTLAARQAIVLPYCPQLLGQLLDSTKTKNNQEKSLILHHRSSIPKKSREKCPIINTQLSGLGNKDNFTRQLQSTIHCNFNFFNCNLTEVKALSLKLQYFSVNWVLPFIFVSVLQDSIKSQYQIQFWKGYVCSQRACMKD